jgi:hypothetical protein
MTQAYIIILKKKDVLTTKIQKIIMLHNIHDAYSYSLVMSDVKKIVYPVDDIENTNIIWYEDRLEYPYFVCKIYPVSCDLIWTIYQSSDEFESDQSLIRYIYERLKTLKMLKQIGCLQPIKSDIELTNERDNVNGIVG